MAKQIKYTNQFRQDAIDMYQKGNDSAAQVARKLGIHEHTMCRWIQLYEKDNTASSQTASCRSVLPGRPCADREFDLNRPRALEYIRAIKIQASVLEQLLLQQTDRKET